MPLATDYHCEHADVLFCTIGRPSCCQWRGHSTECAACALGDWTLPSARHAVGRSGLCPMLVFCTCVVPAVLCLCPGAVQCMLCLGTVLWRCLSAHPLADLSVREHLLFYSRLKGIAPDQEDDHVARAMAQVGLLDFANRRAKQLSGGMRTCCDEMHAEIRQRTHCHHVDCYSPRRCACSSYACPRSPCTLSSHF